MPVVAPSWLIARPIAHRGLHDASRAIIENSLSAAGGAIEHAYAIECDVQVTGDSEAVVFHDFTLDRLTLAQGRLDATPMQAIVGVAMRQTSDKLATFAAFLTH